MKKIVVSGIYAFLIVFAMAIPSFSVNWVRIGSGHYIDSDSIRPSDAVGTYTFDTRYVGEDQPLEEIDGRKVWTINTNSYIDCKTAYGKTLTYTALDKDYKVIIRGKNVQKQWLGLDSAGVRGNDTYAFVCTDRYIDRYHRYNRMWWY